MSTLVMAACWPLVMSPSAKAVLVSLADQANDQGVCWPSIATIAMRTCLSERTVQSALRWLAEQGVVRVEIGAMRANRYTINPRAKAVQPKPDSGHSEPSSLDGRSTNAPARSVTKGANAAPVQLLQGAAAAGGGCDSCTLTVIEPIPNTSPNPLTGATLGSADATLDKAPGRNLSTLPTKQARQPSELLSFDGWLAKCREAGEKPIPPDDPVFDFAAKAGIPEALLVLHWQAFKRRRSTTRKRQAGVKGWRQTFRNSLEGNWFRLWHFDQTGVARLTSAGQALQAVMDAEGKGRAAAAAGQGDD